MKTLVSTLCAVSVACLTTLPAGAQQNTDAAAVDRLIRASSVAFVKAFNAADAKSVAALWTEDGDYVDENGQASHGRAAIQKQYAAFFQNNPGAQIQVAISKIRVINAHTAIEDGTAQLESGGQMTRSRYTAVHSLTDGKWLVSSVRDAAIATPGNHARLADLAWLIGTWHAEHQGVAVEMTFRWMPNKSFIQRSFRVTKQERVLLAGTQFIGWDPIEQRVSSWLFDSTGSYAIGVWAPHDGGWAARTIGVSSDGLVSRSTNVFSRLHDALVWKSINRGAGDFDMIDSEEIVLKRK